MNAIPLQPRGGEHHGWANHQRDGGAHSTIEDGHEHQGQRAVVALPTRHSAVKSGDLDAAAIPGSGARMTAQPVHLLTAVAHTSPVPLTECELDSIAWQFLGSAFTGLSYADWPVDRRIDAYLTRLGMNHILNDGDAYNAVLQHIMANIGPALRAGVLTKTTWVTSRDHRNESPAAPGLPPPVAGR